MMSDGLRLVAFQVLYLQQAEVTRERVYAMQQSSIDGVEDMSALAELHEAAIMHNLYQRYQKDNIYVSAFSMHVVKCVYCVHYAWGLQEGNINHVVMSSDGRGKLTTWEWKEQTTRSMHIFAD